MFVSLLTLTLTTKPLTSPRPPNPFSSETEYYESIHRRRRFAESVDSYWNGPAGGPRPIRGAPDILLPIPELPGFYRHPAAAPCGPGTRAAITRRPLRRRTPRCLAPWKPRATAMRLLLRCSRSKPFASGTSDPVAMKLPPGVCPTPAAVFPASRRTPRAPRRANFGLRPLVLKCDRSGV